MKPMVNTGLAALLAGLSLFACTSRMVAPKPRLGSAVHHVENGFILLDMEKIDAAFREFKMARELDPDYSTAYLGMGLVHALRGEYDDGRAALETARLKAADPIQRIEAFTGLMRFYTLGNTRIKPEWLQEVEQAFEKATALDPDAPAPHFYLGVAYKTAGRYGAAEKAFIRVFEIGKGFVEAADREYTAVQKLKRPLHR